MDEESSDLGCSHFRLLKGSTFTFPSDHSNDQVFAFFSHFLVDLFTILFFSALDRSL